MCSTPAHRHCPDALTQDFKGQMIAKLLIFYDEKYMSSVGFPSQGSTGLAIRNGGGGGDMIWVCLLPAPEAEE